MSARLYHTEIGLPEDLLVWFLGRTFELFYSTHARQAVLDDRFAIARKMPKQLQVRREDVFEVEVTDGEISKFAVRLSSGFEASRPDVDLILVVAPYPGQMLFVRTLWFNEHDDQHKTLDRSKYAQLVS